MKRALLCMVFVLLLAAPSAAQAPDALVRFASVHANAERVNTIQVGDDRGEHRTVVMSVKPEQLGQLTEGDRLEVSSELEVTVCLKPAKHHRGFPCVGKLYGYSPKVTAQVILGRGAGQARGGYPLTEPETLRCSQKQPNRNRHCVLVNDWERTTIADLTQLPCAPDACHANVVVSAYHQKGQRRHRVVIGTNDRRGRVRGDRARLNVVRFRPGDAIKPVPIEESSVDRRKLRVAPDGRAPRKVVIDSMALPGLRQGEGLMASARGVIDIDPLRYNVFLPTELVLTDSPTAVKTGPAARQATRTAGEIGKPNGSNCTQGPSAYRDPCAFRKVGIVRIRNDATQTLYLNLVAGAEAKLLAGQRKRWLTRNHARVRDRGYIRVHRMPFVREG